MVGMAMSIRIRMMAITISNSISVKPLGRLGEMLERDSVLVPRWPNRSINVRFMGFQCLVEQAGGSRPFRQNATTYRREREIGRSEKQLLASSFQLLACSCQRVV